MTQHLRQKLLIQPDFPYPQIIRKNLDVVPGGQILGFQDGSSLSSLLVAFSYALEENR